MNIEIPKDNYFECINDTQFVDKLREFSLTAPKLINTLLGLKNEHRKNYEKSMSTFNQILLILIIGEEYTYNKYPISEEELPNWVYYLCSCINEENDRMCL